MKIALRDPVSGLSHLGGALLGVVALVVLVQQSWQVGTSWHVVSFSIFGVSLVLLYLSSALYHLNNFSKATQVILRRVDHTMIFVLIAGSYTPFCLVPLRGPWGWTLLASIWSLALIGTAISIFWIHAPRWLTTGMYLFAGWVVMIAMPPLIRSASREAVIWLFVGGFFYSVGALIYAFKWPNPFPDKFGFHEVWHLFVLAGSASHVVSVYFLL